MILAVIHRFTKSDQSVVAMWSGRISCNERALLRSLWVRILRVLLPFLLAVERTGRDNITTRKHLLHNYSHVYHGYRDSGLMRVYRIVHGRTLSRPSRSSR